MLKNGGQGSYEVTWTFQLMGPPMEFPMAVNKRLIHGYHACASYLDDNVGLLEQALEKSREANNTIVVFLANHDWKLGDHGSWFKDTNFECDTRIPI